MASKQNAKSNPKVEHGNYTLLQAFEWNSSGGGRHWSYLKSMCKELSAMGITAVWLPPPTKATSPDSAGYDTYDIWDLGEFEQHGARSTKWGSIEDLRELIAEADKQGITCYFDIVMNHRMGADEKETFKVIEVDPDNRTEEISEPYDIEAWTRVDWDALNETFGIDRICGENKGWAQAVDTEDNGNCDFLMGCDLDHAHPDVAEDFIKWGVWLVKEFKVGGFRLDAVRHMDQTFVSKFAKEVKQRTGEDDLFFVGEFWKHDTEAITAYCSALGTQFSCFDAPLHGNFKEAADAGSDYDMRKIFDGTLTQAQPIDSVTIVDSHDLQAGSTIETIVAPYFKSIAYALMLLRIEGYPCVFLGNLYGTQGDQHEEALTQLRDIIQARKLFAYGECHDYFDHQNCIGWVRTGDKIHDGIAVVVCNGDGEGLKHMEVGGDKAGQVWTDLLNWSQEEVTIGEDGWADFKCPAKSLSIWAAKDAKFRNEFGQKA